MVNEYFRIGARGSTVGVEVVGGITTFVTMSYVIFVQPAVLAAAGMDFGAVMTATCLGAALGSLLMGLLANLPVAQAPAMGHNFFFAFTVCGGAAVGGYGFSWQAGLGAILLSGAAMTFLSLFGMRDRVVQLMPQSLKFAIPAGIGLFIAFIGLQWGGVVADAPGTLVTLGDLKNGPGGMVLVTVLLIAFLDQMKVRGAILIGTAFAALWALAMGYSHWYGFAGMPASLSPTWFALDVGEAVSMPQILTVVFIFFILDLFDTIGTLTAVTSRAGLMKHGHIPNAREALFSDGLASVAGAVMGTTTVTSYIESASGVHEGARTGLSAVVTGGMFLLALFLYPLAQMIGGGYEVAEGVYLYPVIAPALITVGAFMVPLAAEVPWTRVSEAVPAFLTMVAMPFTFSITEGVALGIISYSVLNCGLGGLPKTHPVIHFLALLFLLRYFFI